MASFAIGCASDPQLTVRSSRADRSFTQQFTAAYASRAPAGDTDVVLVDRAAGQWLDGGRQTNAPVRQILHIKVLWHPTREMKADHRSASNATVHWYVMGNSPASSAQILEYAGTAFVSLDLDGSQVDVAIRTASIKPVACRGGLCDPVGPSTLHGSIHAVSSRTGVHRALAAVRTAIAAASKPPVDVSLDASKPQLPSSLVQ